LPGVIEDEFIHHLHCRRMMPQDDGSRGKRFERVVKLNGKDSLRLRQRNQVQFRFQHHAERSLGSHHQLRQVDRSARPRELVDVVAPDAPEHFRKSRLHFSRAIRSNLPDSAVAFRFERISG
jgi:hypothetical protein